MAETVLNRAPAAPPEPGRPPSAPRARPIRSPVQIAGARLTLRITGIALALLAVFLLAFAGYLYGLSGVQEARSQAIMFTQLRNDREVRFVPEMRQDGRARPHPAAGPTKGPGYRGTTPKDDICG
ncbi:MAG: hypothetical protein LBV78_19130 [Kitasatospora sp.]|jgi:hypothetical protein|nr:hypothetical protein [Kitasatospora sp.]